LALWALKEAAIKCESGRSNSSALRMLASREISPADLAHILPMLYDAERERRLQSADSGLALVPPRSAAWTWQSPELTMAIVADGSDRQPQWAMPPPAFILHSPSSWAIHVAPP
jgi:hypothetical protein